MNASDAFRHHSASFHFLARLGCRLIPRSAHDAKQGKLSHVGVWAAFSG